MVHRLLVVPRHGGDPSNLEVKITETSLTCTTAGGAAASWRR